MFDVVDGGSHNDPSAIPAEKAELSADDQDHEEEDALLGRKEELCSGVDLLSQPLAFSICLGTARAEWSEPAWCERIGTGDVAAELERDFLVCPMGMTASWHVCGAVDRCVCPVFSLMVLWSGVSQR